MGAIRGDGEDDQSQAPARPAEATRAPSSQRQGNRAGDGASDAVAGGDGVGARDGEGSGGGAESCGAIGWAGGGEGATAGWAERGGSRSALTVGWGGCLGGELMGRLRPISRLWRAARTASSTLTWRTPATRRARAKTKTPSGSRVWSPSSRACSCPGEIRSRFARSSAAIPVCARAWASRSPSLRSSGIGWSAPSLEAGGATESITGSGMHGQDQYAVPRFHRASMKVRWAILDSNQ